jgi:hypothetical protein
MSCAREREIVRGERERGVWGEGRLTGGAHKGKGGGGSNRRVHGARGGGGGGWATEPVQEGERGESRGWAASLAGPRAWPGRKERGGERREKGGFPFSNLFAKCMIS